VCLHLTEKEKKIIIKLRSKIEQHRFGKIELNVYEHSITEKIKVTATEKL